MRHTDTQYADTDLIKAYIARKGVKSFHTEALTFDPEPEVLELGGGWYGIGDGSKHQGWPAAQEAALALSITGTGKTACGDHAVEDLIDAGWARGVQRRGLTEHKDCAKARTEFLEALEEARYGTLEEPRPEDTGDTE